jgi:RNA polymerase sigma-70 factor (ECF subfamily)
VAEPEPAEQAATLLGLYDRGLPSVYGYLVSRCGNTTVAEDLTAETFLAAVAATKKGTAGNMTVAWLVGIARHKLVDHWRRTGREERQLRLLHDPSSDLEDPWDAHLDATRARAVLDELGPHHRAALTLRYLDGLPVAEVAEHLDRTLHATEALLVRARQAFRAAYGERTDDGA